MAGYYLGLYPYGRCLVEAIHRELETKPACGHDISVRLILYSGILVRRRTQQ